MPSPNRFAAALATAALAACAGPPERLPGADLASGPLSLTDWRATNSVGRAGASLFGRVASTEPDTLLGISTDAAGRVTLHRTTAEGRMQDAGPLAVDPGDKLILRDRGTHAMMESLNAPLAPGDFVTVQLRFARAGTVTMRVPVFRLTEASTERR